MQTLHFSIFKKVKTAGSFRVFTFTLDLGRETKVIFICMYDAVIKFCFGFCMLSALCLSLDV